LPQRATLISQSFCVFFQKEALPSFVLDAPPEMSDPLFPAANPALARALAARGYTELTPVQQAVLQPEADARDLLVSAQTGSGKTVAFGLAFAPTLLGGETRLPRAGAPLALIVAPTRELAMQVGRELTWLYAETGARVASCIGGMDGQAEGRALIAGAHIVVGTPGRLCDHLRRGRLNLAELRVVVLDEADEMLDLGFREELEQILQACPEWRRTLLFSATIAKQITALAKTYQQDALRIDTLVRNQPHADIEYRAIRVMPREIEHAVVNVLRYVDSPNALVFCATRDNVRHLQASLMERGFTSVALSGELTQSERTRALQSIRDGQARVCVATDVAARGLDLPDLGLVIHADMPTNKATLLHRSGRTGRAGRKGMCVVVVPANRARAAETLFATAGIAAAWSGPPLAEDIRALDGKRLLEDPVLTEAADPQDMLLARELLAGRSAEDIAAALIRLHRAQLPAPEEITDISQPPPRQQRTPNGARARARAGAAGTAAPAEPRGRHPRPPGAGGTVWFSLPVGRHAKADPKWLLPLICRAGGIERGDVGAIRILDAETRFEISAAAADAFLAHADAEAADGPRISRSDPPPPAAARPATEPKRFSREKPSGKPRKKPG
jgi:ATP-dependent RNA helicase DeaD